MMVRGENIFQSYGMGMLWRSQMCGDPALDMRDFVVDGVGDVDFL